MTTLSIGDQKAVLRRDWRARLARLSAPAVAAASRRLCDILAARPELRATDLVACFAALVGEPDLAPLAKLLLERGQGLCYPRWRADGGVYELARIETLARDLVPGRYGIPEPRPELPALAPADTTITWLVPGLAFARDGVRLGRGGGYYDRLLPTVPGTRIGVAFDWQLTLTLPAADHDVRMHVVATDQGWFSVSGGYEREDT